MVDAPESSIAVSLNPTSIVQDALASGAGFVRIDRSCSMRPRWGKLRRKRPCRRRRSGSSLARHDLDRSGCPRFGASFTQCNLDPCSSRQSLVGVSPLRIAARRVNPRGASSGPRHRPEGSTPKNFPLPGLVGSEPRALGTRDSLGSAPAPHAIASGAMALATHTERRLDLGLVRRAPRQRIPPSARRLGGSEPASRELRALGSLGIWDARLPPTSRVRSGALTLAI